MKEEFEKFLRERELSPNTVRAYVYAVRKFESDYGEWNRRNLLAFKGELVECCKPKTVNLRIQGVNRYLKFMDREGLALSPVKLQQKNFLENVISNADYRYLLSRLKADGQREWYFVVRYLAATGARIGELLQLKLEHVQCGYFDLYAKGGKLRRLYIPEKLREETFAWLKEAGRGGGFLFLNRFGERVTARGVGKQLKSFAVRYGIDPRVVYPHSFRHRFAKNFLEKCNDIALLADLMGHESIETTRIYLRRTSSEQKEIVDRIVTW